jgi:hypothetical protein
MSWLHDRWRGVLAPGHHRLAHSGPWLVATAVAFCLGVGLGATAFRGWKTGSAAEWVAGLATAAAVALALFQWHRDRVDRSERDARRQAEQVAVWIEANDPSVQRRSGFLKRVHVRNPTSSAIFNVVIWDLTTQRPDGSWAEDPPLDVDHLLRVGTILPPETTHTVEMVLAAVVLEDPWLGIAFTDAAGRHWLREAAELRSIDRHPFQLFRLDL